MGILSNLNIKRMQDDPSSSDVNFVSDHGYCYRIVPNTKSVYVYFNCGFSDISTSLKLIGMINSLSEEHTLHFSINSPGGELNYIYALLSAIKRTKALVIMCNTGFAASCGSLLLSSGDQIYIAPQAITMFHGPTSFNYGKSIYSKTSNDILLDTVKVHLKDIVAKGILLEEEYEGIFTRDDEYFIPSDVMITRLKNNNLWYEKGGVL